MHRSEQRGFNSMKRAGYLLLVAGLPLWAGCATVGKTKAESGEPGTVAAAEPSPVVPKGPSVVHFTDGREGFQITQLSDAGGEVRGDFEQASAMIRGEKYDTAIELLEKVIARTPELTAPRINVAIAYGRMNKSEQAEPHLKKALESVPGHPVASNEYGLLLRKAGRFTEARAMYERSLASFPEYHPIHRNLAILCDVYLKDFACAAEHFEAYGRAMPNDQQVKLWLADLQTRSGSNITASAGFPLTGH